MCPGLIYMGLDLVNMIYFSLASQYSPIERRNVFRFWLSQFEKGDSYERIIKELSRICIVVGSQKRPDLRCKWDATV